MFAANRLAPAFLLLAATTASASPATEDAVGSFDLAIGGALLQSATNRSSTHDVSGAGGSAELQLGYRVTPRLALGAYGTFEAGEPTIGAAHRVFVGGSTGLRAEWHFDPSRAVDSWASIGAGARWMSLDDDRMHASTDLLAVDIARLQFGGDFRLSSAVTIGPAVSVTASTFVAERITGDGEFDEIANKAVDLVIAGGLRMRFHD